MLVDLISFWVKCQSLSSLFVTPPLSSSVLLLSEQFLSVVRQFLVSRVTVRELGQRAGLRGRGHSEDPGVDERIILRLIFRKWDVGVWI